MDKSDDRRINLPIGSDIYHLYIQLQRDLSVNVENIMTAFREHTEKEDARYAAIIEKITELETLVKDLQQDQKNIIKAFSNEDPIFHRNWHDLEIENSKESKEIQKDVKKKIIGGITWGALLLMGYAIWEWFKLEVKKL